MPLSPSSLRETLALAGFPAGARVEFASIHPRGSINALWIEAGAPGLQRASRWLGAREGKHNLYLLANPLLADADRAKAKRATDEHCASAATLLLDVDPVKVRERDVKRGLAKAEDLDPLGIRPAKLAAADEIARELVAFVEERLGARPLLLDSGRGRQAWLRLEEHPLALRRRLVHGLARRFDRPGLAEVDRSTHNVARLMRLPGSRNLRTGRAAAVLAPGGDGTVTLERIEALVAELDPPGASAATPTPGKSLPPSGGGSATEASAWTAAIRAAADVHRGLALLGLPVMPAGGHNTACPIHGGDSPSGFSVSADGQLWKCWTGGCVPRAGQLHAAGDVIELAARVRGIDRLEARRWLAGAVGVDRPEEPTDDLLPLADTIAPPRVVTGARERVALVAAVLRGPKDEPGRVVCDRRPTGAGKTTQAAAALVAAALEGEGRYTWASPTHDHGRVEVLGALAAAGAVVWDVDLLGDPEDPQTAFRSTSRGEGATVIPLGAEAPGGEPIAAKLPPFLCPGPEVPGWTPESVGIAYQDSAARGWNPAGAVCRACPRFSAPAEELCPFWAIRRKVVGADLLVVPHHAARPGSGACDRRRALVVDEDPSGALVRRYTAGRPQVAAFRALLAAALDHLASEAERKREEIEPAPPAQVGLWREDPVDLDPEAAAVRRAVGELLDRHELLQERADAAGRGLDRLEATLLSWEAAPAGGEPLAPIQAVPAPLGAALEAGESKELRAACEQVLRERAREGKQGGALAGVRNLLPLLHQLGRAWVAGEPAVVHVDRGRGRRAVSLVVPAVSPLPDLPILALDATGDPRLLELATGRPVELIEGDMTGRLTGVHLAGVPCGRRRWIADPKRSKPETVAKAAGRLDRDLAVVARYARRVGAERIGLVTFKGVVDAFAAGLERTAGVEVRQLHYGAERGSNVFEHWADLVVLAGTPFVPPAELRLRASLEGAGVEELLADPAWERRRLPGGGTAQALAFPGDATRRAYAALVRSSLEQALGRALRGSYVPRLGVLVLAEPWPTRHRLRVTTRRREALEGPPALLADELAWHPNGSEGVEDPERVLARRLVALVASAGGASAVAEDLGISARSVRLWVAGSTWPGADHLRKLC